MKKYIYELLMNQKEEIQGFLDSPTKKIYKLNELKTFLRGIEFLKTSEYSTVLNVKDLVEFLIKKKVFDLRKVSHTTNRKSLCIEFC